MSEPLSAPADLPLSGVRVIDCVDGPLQSVGRIFADLGAEVVRIEPPEGSASRTSGTMFGDLSLTFATRNANKLGVSVDIRDPSGERQFRSLVSTADILIFDWTPAEQRSRDLDREALARLNPGLVAAALSDFGRTGPRSDWLATPDVHFALSTVLSRSGLPEVAEPLLPPSFLAYEAAAAQAAWSVMLAYVNAMAHHRGDYVDFSVSEALVQVLDPPYGIGGSARAGESMKNLPSGRPDARHLYPIFRARDGWVRICVLSARQWQGMFDWLGRPEEFADAKYHQLGVRFAAAGRLYPLIGSLFANLTREQATQAGQSHGVPTAGVLSTQEVLQVDAFRESGSVTEVQLAPAVAASVPTGVYELDGRRSGVRWSAPAIGEHNEMLAEDRTNTGRAWPRSDAPFAGFRVLDLGVIVVGAELGRLFADYGADVIKVESREFPDGSRQSFDGSEMTEGFAWGHRNKRSLGLNLKSVEGKKLFADLVAQADVVLTNFKPGTLESLGFGFDVLSAINPGIVLSQSSAFGYSGPWSTRLGYGPLVRAGAGMSELWSYPDVQNSFSDAITIFPDHVVARLNAVAVTALLLRRARTGRGGQVSTAQVDTIFAAMADQMALESLAPGSVRPQGNSSGVDAPRGIFATSGQDNWIVVDPVGDEQFGALAVATGHPEWLQANATADDRLRNEAMLTADLSEWMRSRDAVTTAAALQAAGVPAGQMMRHTDLETDEQFAQRHVFGQMYQPQIGRAMTANLGEARFDHLAQPLLGAAPLQAEHTREIVSELLGLPDDEISRLIEEGTLQVHPSLVAADISS